jgi:transcriptional regulator
MHPNSKFRWIDEPAMLDFIAEVGFGQVFVASDDGPAVCQVPLLVAAGALRFHVARRNACASVLDGATALASVVALDGYVSPDWYGTPNEVPTWNYVAAEAIGPVRRLPRAELIDLLDRLSAIQESRLAPKTPWTRAKLEPALLEGLVKSIVGFELRVNELRGTRKLSQNKPVEAIARAASTIAERGNRGLAAAMLANVPFEPSGGEN